MNKPIPPNGKWTIARHSGRSNSEWLVILISEQEDNARRIYDTYQKLLTRGAIRLIDPEGTITLQHTAVQVLQ